MPFVPSCVAAKLPFNKVNIKYLGAREPGEGFGDFCRRVGVPALREAIAGSRGKGRDAAD